MRWPGGVFVAIAVALAVASLDLLRHQAGREDRRDRATAIAAAMAAGIDSADQITPAFVARMDAFSGATVRAHGRSRTVTADGVGETSRSNVGVPVPSAPDWRLDVVLPATSAPVIWLDATIAGTFAGVATGLIGRRLRRDARRLRRDLDGLLRQEPRAEAGTRRRVSIPETSVIADAVRPLNELLAAITRRLEESDAGRGRQSLVIESMASGVLVLDARGAIDTANPAARQLLEITQVSPRGLRLSEAVRESDLHDMVARAIESGKPQRRVFRSARSSPEKQRELATAVAPIVDRRSGGAAPTLGGVVILIEDATYLRRLERARTEFVGNVSHELRTPITNLLGYIDTALELDDVDDRETRRKFLGVAQRNARRLASIIEDLLSLATLEAPGRRLDRDPIRVRSLLDRIADRHRTDLGDDPRRIEVTCDASIETYGVATLLDQAIENLVTNALRYGSPEGRVLLEAAREGKIVRIAVADDGPGIPPRHLPRLFERFYRVDTARSRQEGGTGLGLAIVKHIVAAHDGTVEAESVLGIGSRFTIRIPDPTSDTQELAIESAAPPVRASDDAGMTGLNET